MRSPARANADLAVIAVSVFAACAFVKFAEWLNFAAFDTLLGVHFGFSAIRMD